MAPDGISEVAPRTARSSKQSDFERDVEGNTQELSNTQALARAPIRSAKWLRSRPEQRSRSPSGCRARPIYDLDRDVRKSSARAAFSSVVEYEEACSSSDFER